VLVVCPPGLEDLVANELVDLGAKRRRIHKGAVATDLTTRQLYAANRSLRCATRVLVRVAGFTARSFADLQRRLGEVDWSSWLAEGARPAYRVTSRGSQLVHTGAIEERFAAAMGAGYPDGPEQLVVVRVSRDRFTVSVDSSGAPLHMRGWRQATAKAPLRESVAAGMLLAAGWDPTTPLVDPMCGSGTIAIEAALLAAGRAPGAGRTFAFQQWPSFEPGTWASVTASPEDPVAALPAIVGSDRDAGAVEAARSNAERAGVADLVEFRQAPISDLEAPGEGPGHLVTNPPWGGRLSPGGDLRNLYATLGRVAAERLPGWGLGLLVTDRDLARQVRPGLTESLHLDLGGQRATFLTGRLS
jgi:putative N6-adenine-specific DNA methylase